MQPAARWRELSLLVIAGAFYAVGYASLLIVRDVPMTARAFDLPLAFGGALLAVHVWFCIIGFRGDQMMFPCVAMLVAISLLMVDRLRPSLVNAQMTWFWLGCAVLVATATFGKDMAWLSRYKYTFAVVGLGLLLLTAVAGREINGARLWLGVGPFQFQTSELMKLVLVIFIAGYVEEKQELLSLTTFQWTRLRFPPVAYLGPLLAMWMLSLLSLVWQRDLGGTLLLLGVALAMLYIGTGRKSYVAGGVALFMINLFVTYQLFSYVRNRILIWLHPWQYAQDKSYQVVQALYAFSSGGLIGSGLGQGSPRYIPEVHTDFIFAAIAEELGLLGAFAVLLLVLVLVFRGLRTAVLQERVFEQLLSAGLASVLGLQCLVIAAGNLSIIPLTGITFPFVSYGGSSMFINFVMIGILLQLSATRPRQPAPAALPEGVEPQALASARP